MENAVTNPRPFATSGAQTTGAVLERFGAGVSDPCADPAALLQVAMGISKTARERPALARGTQ